MLLGHLRVVVIQCSPRQRSDVRQGFLGVERLFGIGHHLTLMVRPGFPDNRFSYVDDFLPVTRFGSFPNREDVLLPLRIDIQKPTRIDTISISKQFKAVLRISLRPAFHRRYVADRHPGALSSGLQR